MPWFELKGDSRLGRCDSEGCGGQPTWRLEANGVGSNYCSGCKQSYDDGCERMDNGRNTGGKSYYSKHNEFNPEREYPGSYGALSNGEHDHG